jgi:hypothetical protein
VYWGLSSNDVTATKIFATPATFTQFNGKTPAGTWNVWIEGAEWNTVTGGTIRIDYTY